MGFEDRRLFELVMFVPQDTPEDVLDEGRVWTGFLWP
jgi:hypothetical protein